MLSLQSRKHFHSWHISLLFKKEIKVTNDIKNEQKLNIVMFEIFYFSVKLI